MVCNCNGAGGGEDMNAAERALIDGIKKGMYKDQRAFYMNYTAAISSATLAGVPKEKAARLVDIAVEENQRDMKEEVEAANRFAMNFLENLLGLGKELDEDDK